MLEEILLEMKSTAEIARLEGRLARQVVSFTRASSVKRGVAEELAMALCLTKFKAHALIGNAEGLVDRFPLVLGLVEEGRMPMASAVAVNNAAAWLDDDKAPVVDEVMAGRLTGKNPTAAAGRRVRRSRKLIPKGSKSVSASNARQAVSTCTTVNPA